MGVGWGGSGWGGVGVGWGGEGMRGRGFLNSRRKPDTGILVINKAKAKANAKFSVLQHAEVQKHKAKMFNNEMLILSFKQY